MNITIQIDTEIRKKKPFDGTPSLELAVPVGWVTFAAARLIRLRHLAPRHPSQRPSGAAGTSLGG